MYQKSFVKTLFIIIVALVTWFAVILQFSISFPAYLAIGRTVGGIIVQLLSFFTVLSNILVAISLTFLLLKPTSKWGVFFTSNSAQGATAAYIAVVGIVYNTVLRGLLELEGYSALANELLHVVVPVIYVVYWVIFAAKTGLKWSDIYYWLIFPLVYLVFTLIRGEISGLYPYPFMNVTKLGYATVAINSLALVIGFVIISALFILIGKTLTKKAETTV